MDFKPNDFFVGVIDFFAVLLPGAILAAILRPQFYDAAFGPGGFLPYPAEGLEAWLGFFIAAYLLGHLLFLLGALIDSPLYDPLRRKAIPKDRDQAFQAATELKNKVLPVAAKADLNTFKWARATVQLRAPTAWAELERYEADSKFFRSLSIALYGLLLVVLGRLASEATATGNGSVRSATILGFAAAIALPLWLIIAQLWRGQRDKRRPPNSERLPELFTFWPLVSLIVLVLLLSAVVLASQSREQPLILLLGWALAVWGYADRRWKSTKAAYHYSVILYEQVLPPQQTSPS